MTLDAELNKINPKGLHATYEAVLAKLVLSEESSRDMVDSLVAHSLG